jgi:UDP-N-acetylmuramoylalanine--D-glutamate ligase
VENLVVLGAGESGCGAAILGKKKGFNVFVSDKGTISKKSKDVLSHNNIPFEEEKHSERQILDADLVIKSPGIPDTIPLIQAIEKQGIPIIDELEFASR